MTPTQDTVDHVWRRRAEASLKSARQSLAQAGLAFADDSEITTAAYYLRYETIGPSTPHGGHHEEREY